jgi:RNA polymerase sigma-70 factor (ECF subfamily)
MPSSTVIDRVVAASASDDVEAARERQFTALLAANGAALARLAASYTPSVSDRDDLLQEIALAVWQALPRFRGECSERTFLFRIAHNRAVTHATRRRAHGVADSTSLDPTEAGATGSEPRDPAPDPETGLARHERRTSLLDAVRRLPLGYRQVLTLTLEGLDYREVGQVLGISENNVGVRLNRARRLLRELMEPQR